MTRFALEPGHPGELRHRNGRLRVLLPLLAVLLFGSLTLAACGEEEDLLKPPDYATSLADAPPRLAALHEQGNELIEGGLPAFQKKMESLRGFPVAVNVWASWCAPCRAELPHFQKESAAHGTRVAFLGVDSDDNAAAAATFLEDRPLPYPSFSDPDKKIATYLGVPRMIPATIFFDADGNKTFTNLGSYATREELAEQIREHALAGRPG